MNPSDNIQEALALCQAIKAFLTSSSALEIDWMEIQRLMQVSGFDRTIDQLRQRWLFIAYGRRIPDCETMSVITDKVSQPDIVAT
jgi:hypothetical protein